MTLPMDPGFAGDEDLHVRVTFIRAESVWRAIPAAVLPPVLPLRSRAASASISCPTMTRPCAAISFGAKLLAQICPCGCSSQLKSVMRLELQIVMIVAPAG